MSEVAGRMAVQEGAKYLEKVFGGSGILLGGVPGVAPGEVVIIGGGVVGINAAKMAAGLGAHVTILDISLDRLRYLDDVLPANVDTAYSNRHNILDAIRRADLVIGAVLLPGAKAPHLVKRADLKLMKPGSVIVDVAVDQGGCVETIKPTTHENPTYFVDGILHYAVANMPGGVPRTSTLALTNATLPYGLKLAKQGWRAACKADPRLRLGLNVVEGKVVYPGVAEAFRLPLVDVGVRSSDPTILITRLPHGEGLPLPSPATPGSAGYDLASAEDGGPGAAGARAVPDRLRDRSPGGLRVPDPAPVGPGAQARHHAAQHAGDDRQRLPGRAEGHPGEPGRRAVRGDPRACGSRRWCSRGWSAVEFRTVAELPADRARRGRVRQHGTLAAERDSLRL